MKHSKNELKCAVVLSDETNYRTTLTIKFKG